ncbi:MAG: alpha/beta fold hydrolase [Pseudomonadaceae bacterium]|nr:alpha/beta fold hydrolase [Pseudomonadaceae bacterium]
MTTPLPQPAPPSRANLFLEARVPLEFGALMLSAPGLLRLPKGDGRAIILLPGYMASPSSMWPLAQFLRHLNYTPLDWGLGTNRGKVDADVQRLSERLPMISAQHGPVTLIGWSLGGVISRETARLNPEMIAEVITMGTPVIGGPKYTTVGEVFARSEGLDLDEFEKEVHARNLLGLRQPLTCIYSRSDGVVSWEAARDIYNDHARNIEVVSSHVGLGFNPSVWRIIGKTLAGDR